MPATLRACPADCIRPRCPTPNEEPQGVALSRLTRSSRAQRPQILHLTGEHMAFPILGLHHVTATVDQAQPDLDFCRGALGLRLVKKTVNFDNHNVYHFYYGDERGSPGTIWTTFPYRGHGVKVGTKGAGQV